MRNVVDHICTQLAHTKLLTCHNRRSVGKPLDNVWDSVDTLCIFSRAHVSHRSLELCEWVKRWRGRSRPYRSESRCQLAPSWLLRYGHSPPTDWLPPWRPHHWCHRHPWMTRRNWCDGHKRQTESSCVLLETNSPYCFIRLLKLEKIKQLQLWMRWVVMCPADKIIGAVHTRKQNKILTLKDTSYRKTGL